jgi:hypothetical protein
VVVVMVGFVEILMKALPCSASVRGLGTAHSLSVGLVAYQFSLLLCVLGEKKFFKEKSEN